MNRPVRVVGARFTPYAAYRDSGVEWLGKIPAHWSVVRSRRLFHLRDTRALASDQQLTASQEYGVIPQSEFMEREGRRVVQVLKGADILKHVEPNDFVISMRSFQGGIELANCRGAISSAYVVLVPNSSVHTGYFARLLKSKLYIQALQSTSNLVRDGQALRFANFALVDLPVVPLPEQRAIAAFLDRETAKIDTLVAKKERLIELLQEKRAALIARAVTKGLDPNVSTKDSGVDWLGEIPAHWGVSKAGAIATATSGGTPARDNPEFWNGDIPWVSPKDMKRDIIAESEETVSEAALRNGRLKLVPHPVVLIVVRGMILAHSFPVAVTAAPVTINQDMKALRTGESVLPGFLAQFLRGVAKAILAGTVGEAAHGTKAIRMDRWRSFPIAVPPLGEQAAIAAFVQETTGTLDRLTQRVNEAIDRLGEYRTALISAAVTGKIDVREEAA